MNSSQATLKAFTDAAAAAVARAISGLQREAQREREVRDAEHRARLSDLDARLAAVTVLERKVEDRLVALKDGEPGASVTIEDVEPLIVAECARLFAAMPKPKDGDPGQDADMTAVELMLDQKVRQAVADLPAAEKGADADPELIEQMVLGAVESRVPAKSDIVRLIEEAVSALPKAPAGKDADPEIIKQMVAAAVASLPIPADGRDADPDVIRLMVAEAVAALPPAPAGKDADPTVIASLVADAVAALPPPTNGRDADPEIIRSMVDEAVAAIPPAEKGPPGKDGAPGKLPLVREWSDRVYYEGEVATFAGATYQAHKDTGRTPPHEDWVCIASAGRDGADGIVPEICGTYSADNEYKALNIVALNGASFAARRDDPGPCPGDGWQLIAARGKSGPPGDGRRGEPGKAGPGIVAADVNDEGMLTIMSADGSVVSCDLYPLLQKVSR